MTSRICVGLGLAILGLSFLGLDIKNLDFVTGFLLFIGGVAMLAGY